MKKISIIIPVYNAEKYLKRCIESIYKQTYKNFEIIVVDDGSTDNTNSIYNVYKTRNNFKIISQSNSGPSSARNNGIENSKGDFIFFLDSDDYLEENCLKGLVENFESNILVGLKHQIVYNNKVTKKKCQDKYDIRSFQKSIIDGEQLGVVWGFLFESKIIFNNNMRFDVNTSLSEDTIFLFEYLKEVKGIKFINEFYNYYQTNNSITKSKNIDRIISNILNSFYSIKCLDEITNYDFNNQLNNTQVRLLKCELYKIGHLNDFKKVLLNKKIKKQIKCLLEEKIRHRDKITILMLLYCKSFIYIMIKLKKIRRYILNRIIHIQ